MPEDFDVNPRSKANYLVNMKGVLNEKRNNHGERCSVNYKLEVARAVSFSVPFQERLAYPHIRDRSIVHKRRVLYAPQR
jgi:DNA-directed RNA polymerase